MSPLPTLFSILLLLPFILLHLPKYLKALLLVHKVTNEMLFPFYHHTFHSQSQSLPHFFPFSSSFIPHSSNGGLIFTWGGMEWQSDHY
ncbi:hypothetical protein LINGRAHAP2_LOCUS15689 [Linum grandiflorum]